ncbi:DEAD/DEAH box helicase [Streptomyces lydicus]|uniref:DEAD/DEAH box helicase n=1 Tax=Streptomyces lydicus TaxID=47763 RepID=UPI0013E98A2A|nr:ATP-binding protein [Streptomyces lydicus]MCZ1007077.1 AAA domain-containing protein [Streptomyces lydicus]
MWRHTVYAGIFAVDKVRNVLLEAFRVPDAEQDFDGRTGGDGAVLCFMVNEDGQLIKDSVTLSSCAWAIGQTLVPGPHDDQWLTGFEEQSTLLLQRLLDLGDGKVDVERCPAPDRESTSAGLGTVAGLMSRIAVSAAKGGLGVAAAAAGAGLGPVGGAVTAKVIEQVGGEMLDAAASGLANRRAGNAVPPDQEQDGAAEQSVEEPETAAEGPPAEVGTKILDVHDLAAVTRWVAEQLGVAEALKPNAIRVKSYLVSAKHADDSSGDVFLNSFYADDLERVADSVEAGQAGTALLDYLRDEADLDAALRCDVRSTPATVLEHVQPVGMPLGRWPADNDKPLVLSQQFAVNRIMDTLGADDGRGVYAVNGPPGTGKTTMLRDLIAALVVRRAERLATLDSPELAFDRKPLSWRTEETAGRPFPRSIRPLIPELTGFEMVIASSNNGAVENVTLEVPGARAIGDAWKPYADYLSGPASLLLDDDAWGAIAARLGRRSNRSDFVERFWWGEAAKNSGRRQKGVAGEAPPRQGLQEMLQLQRTHVAAASREHRGAENASPDAPATPLPLGRETWTQAVDRFSRARTRVREMAAERQEIADLSARMTGPDALLDELLTLESQAHDAVRLLQEEQRHAESAVSRTRDEYTRRRTVVSSARTRLDSAETAVRGGEESVRAAEASLRAHDETKPGRFKRVFTREPMRRWEADRVPFASHVAAADARLAGLDSLRVARHADLRTAQEQLDEALAAVRNAEARLAMCEQARERQIVLASEAGQQVTHRRREREAEHRRLTEASERWGASLPGAEWQARPDDRGAMEKRELSAPWMDPEFAAARSELFLAALTLHRALLATSPDLMRKNLQAVMDVIKGQAPADLPARTVLAAWQMLFLVVPVVSTTFASAGRMFSRLGSEALGWLFVDEAGQAAPQEVVGALWRSRRAVVVGDPLQLEPVVTLPWTGQQRLAGHFSVHRQWAPAAASVQTLADRLNEYGTWLRGDDGERVWLGSPLRVHRRCDRLMFDVSNKIAYDGMMIYGVSRDQDDFAPAPWSIWMDVGSLPGEEKWNPEEGRRLELSLDQIGRRIAATMREERRDTGAVPPAQGAAGGEFTEELTRLLNESVFVVSPFRDVVSGIGRVAGKRLDPRRYGTVHTTQGKEADIVILVLGTGADQVNSRAWASQKPNLLNVAVTRARRRLIVIGDFDAWSRHRYFRDLAEHDEIRRWTPGH